MSPDLVQLSLVANGILTLALLYFLWRRSLTFLRYFQQEEYNNKRFLCWIFTKRLYDRRLSVLLITIILVFLTLKLELLSTALAVSALILASSLECDPRQTGKKKLVMTRRSIRILAVAMIIGGVLAVVAVLITPPWIGRLEIPVRILSVVVIVQVAPFFIVVSNILLCPIENKIQKFYLKEAKVKLQRLDPVVIAITGSFGKTTTKHLLGHILSMAAPTLITPASVNTLMGISRVIRESLSEQHRYFVIELGAYGPGSVAALCKLATPDFGAITAVGNAHYERFKSIDTVATSKFELVEEILANSGTIIINADQIDKKYLKTYITAIAANQIQVVTSQPHVASLYASGALVSELHQTTDGLTFVLEWQKRYYTVAAPIYGIHNIANLAVAFMLSAAIGVPADSIVAALRTVPQIPHRLEVLRNPNNPIVIDDSYNSNPVGFASALDLMKLLCYEGGRRIVVTPGMVELGALHAIEHYHIGRLVGDTADLVLVVAPQRIPTFLTGFEHSSRSDHQILLFPDFATAKARLSTIVTPKDIVLFENDLPDLYEVQRPIL